MKVFFLTTFALVAFAFNSILCRMALGSSEIDAAGFTVVRLVAGAATLIVISLLCTSPRVSKGDNGMLNVSTLLTRGLLQHGSWPSAFFLFAYAICFSFAYLGLTTATGALILFGCVQMTMIGMAIINGSTPTMLEWLGLAVAVCGLVYMVFPGLSSPPLPSSLLMAAAGVAWGFYTLRGKGSNNPLADTTGNFVRSVPMVIVAAIPFLSELHLSSRGIILAILSGSVASGIGYTVWYAALKYHTSTRAAVLQLSVPVIAAGGGVLFLSETADMRLLIAAALILGGIALTIAGKSKVFVGLIFELIVRHHFDWVDRGGAPCGIDGADQAAADGDGDGPRHPA
ncbi:MAG: DMT family transporter [Pyrinomonadaceae bacterium]